MISRVGAVVFGALAMLFLLSAAAAVSHGAPERAAGYVIATALSALLVARLMRGEMRRRRAAEALLPLEQRPARRVPRRSISFPVRETAVAFAIWYAIAVAFDRAVTGTTTVFTLAVIAPFAAFMLAAMTIAGRHMAFRLTAEESEEGTDRN